MRAFLRRFMEREGFVVDEASDGGEALCLMQRRFYDVAFVDLEMPVMGGLDCAAALRAWERSIQRPFRQRICAVSSHSSAKEATAFGAGFDHYQTKPIAREGLLEIAARAARETALEGAPDGPPDGAPRGGPEGSAPGGPGGVGAQTRAP